MGLSDLVYYIIHHEREVFSQLELAWAGVAALAFIALFVIKAPYGRYMESSSFTISPSLGWFIMESPTLFLMPYLYYIGDPVLTSAPLQRILLVLFLVHYVNRTVLQPLFHPNKNAVTPMHILVVALAFIFQLGNTYFIGRGLFTFGNTASDVNSPFFFIGVTLFVIGMVINLWADRHLRWLRNQPGDRYKLPRGGLFDYISCPNYFGETVEWCGYALAAGSTGAWLFELWTVANLLPRAISHHKFYRQKFKGYPPNRKAMIPFLL
eukprot:TRINITY_DN7028_c0_g1_i2.p1 TRINITY_DN7028_c0_g1~~TRINITY_DN7028_c0_g1_i2.p1  ORF type:complete len:266 (+),score=42.89 TRINITY_DN7028_c0_g1_i2:26-823(+)